MKKSIFTAIFLAVLFIAGCGIFGSDPRSPVITVASGDAYTLSVGGKDTIAFTVWTPRTPETASAKSRTGLVSTSITSTGSSTDTAFTGSVFLTAGSVAGLDTVQIQLLYNGSEDAVKDLYITVIPVQ